jgi:predicted ThiF/HesA family dinucleotide-utilizing enzyme
VWELWEGVKDDRPERKSEERRFVARAASAEVNGRRVNEAIERGTESARGAVFVCECGNLGCTATVELTIAEYELVRSGFDRFLVIPGHEIERVEDVVERHDGYFVVAKRDGQAVAMATVTDDRDEG